MGELAEYWKDVKEDSKERRQSNYEKNRQVLIESRIEFKEFANGHFRVAEYDFWATTGLFKHLKTGKRGRGVRNLILLVGLYPYQRQMIEELINNVRTTK